MRASTTQRRLGRRCVAPMGAMAALLGVAACANEVSPPDVATGGDLGEFAATSDYLSSVAQATDGLSYRMSMDMTMAMDAPGESFEIGGDIMTGEVDGDTSSMTMDMGALFDDIADMPADDGLPDSFLDADLTMEMVTDGDTLYLRAPFFTAMAEMALDSGATRGDLGPLADLAELGDQWGRIDLSEASPSEVAAAAGGQTSDPRVFLDIVAHGTDVRDLGTQTIDGDETRGLGATVTYEDMIVAQDIELDDFREQMGASAGEAPDDVDVDELVEAMLAMEMPVEVWVDDEDRVRRISMGLDMGPVFEGLDNAEIGEVGMAIDFSIEFTDYGDESIEIEVPSDAVDITDEFLELQEGGGLGGGTGGSPLGSS